jgi:hypothetical protein
MNRHFVSDKERNASTENSKVKFSKSYPLTYKICDRKTALLFEHAVVFICTTCCNIQKLYFKRADRSSLLTRGWTVALKTTDYFPNDMDRLFSWPKLRVFTARYGLKH